MKYKKSPGFTFVEIMIVTAILSFIGLVFAAVLNNGMAICERINSITSEEDIVIFFEKFSTNLRNSIKYSNIGFLGTSDSLSIPSLQPAEGNVILPGRTTYFFDRNTASLKRKRESYSQLYKGTPGPSEQLVMDVVLAKFLYYAYDEKKLAYYWQDTCKEGTPRAVKLEITLKKEDKTFNYVKTINIPIAKIEHTKL